ncbi:alginate export family protein [Microbulbifer donghaiensis]|nr:alginate export family protein [Microbulbifer donghaiensis]
MERKTLLALTLLTLIAESVNADTASAAGNDDSAQAAAATAGEALALGKVTLGLRARSELVEIDGADTVDLSSLRTRLTYESASFQGLSALIEMDDVTHLSEFEGGVTDPQGTEVNRASLSYSAGGTTIRYGRQRILLDNQRFVGGVGFRQNEQTYDGISITNSSLTNTRLFLAHIDNVNRIFGEDSPLGDHKSDSYLLNANYSGFSAGSVSAYAYLLDNRSAPAFSTDTYGLRFEGATGAASYALEYATQSAAAENPASYDADYRLLEGGYKLGTVTLKTGYEQLGADGSSGQFITPLATLHKFQGWNDKFLGGGSGNIPGGIEDIYAVVGTSLAGVKISLNYHQLSSEEPAVSGMDKLGSEYGVVIGGKIASIDLSLKYSNFTADEFSSDTTKWWLTALANF